MYLAQKYGGWTRTRPESQAAIKYVQVAGPLSLAPRFNRTKLRDEVLQSFQYTNPLCCHTYPGVKYGGWKRTRLESQVALSTYRPPGRTFNVIEVGMRRSVLGTGHTVKTCCPAGKKPLYRRP